MTTSTTAEKADELEILRRRVSQLESQIRDEARTGATLRLVVVNSYIVKPVDFDQFTEVVRQLGYYWLLLNQPPVPGS